MLKVDKDSKVDFYNALLPLYLAVGLGMEGGRKLLLDPKRITKQWPKLWGKQQAFIRHNWVRQAVVPDYHVENDLASPGVLIVIFTSL